MTKNRFLNRKSFFFLCGMLGYCMMGVHPLEAAPFFAYEGKRTGWYFNLMNGPNATGLKGPYPSQELCLAQSRKKKNTSICYERETVEFFRWRQNSLKAWVLPLKTGQQSTHLIFKNRSQCHQVAHSGFYYADSGVKLFLGEDLRYCLNQTVNFDEFEQQYLFADRHPRTSAPYPKKYKAWSMVVDQGKYQKLLQFPYQKHCEQVSRSGKYYSLLARSGFGTMKIVRMIPKKLRLCQRRGPRATEVPITYRHFQEHDFLKQTDRHPVEKKDDFIELWTMAIGKPGGSISLYFENRRDCLQVQQHRFYFREINRGGIFPSKALKSSIQKITQKCALQEFSKKTVDRVYPFARMH